jgi:hypothetical protein
MWLAFFVIFGAIFVIIAGILSGGIFTIILVPLAVVALIAWGVYSAAGYFATSMSPQSRQGGSLPHSDHTNTASRPTTPDEFVDARQHQ